jgi:predicted Zn-dependent protease
MKRIAAATLALALLSAGAAPALAQAQAQDQEQQIGAQVYQQLKQKGEIIARPNAMYSILDPIAARIAKIADPQYTYPFQFILVHEKDPNAFAVPGGNVYVTDSLIHFVQNTEELSGVLCHETSHDIHHDVVNLNGKSQAQGAIIGIIGAITGIDRYGLGQAGEQMLYTVQTDHFSRAVESAADHKGAITCAQANYNPWGMVWLFQHFQQSGQGGTMEMLSDHPSDSHRIDALEAEFRSDAGLFGRFSSNIADATPLTSTAAARPEATGGPRTAPAYCCGPRASSPPTPAPAITPDVSIIQGR